MLWRHMLFFVVQTFVLAHNVASSIGSRSTCALSLCPTAVTMLLDGRQCSLFLGTKGAQGTSLCRYGAEPKFSPCATA